MTPTRFMRILALGLVLANAARADWPPPSLRGKVHDVSSGKPIPGVHIVAYFEGTGGGCEAKSDSTGSYRVAVGSGALVVYEAVGYCARALMWPEELSSAEHDPRGSPCHRHR